jgi:hypothetical protein
VLGAQTANEVRDAALLHVVHMGATVVSRAKQPVGEMAISAVDRAAQPRSVVTGATSAR